MKKLSLKNATSMLSRNEMKAVLGGYGSDDNCCIAYGDEPVPQWSCGYSFEVAQAYYLNGGRGYCCISCGG